MRKDLITTSGTEEILSDIMVFKVKDFSSISTNVESQEGNSPAGILLRNIIGDELANNIFCSGGEGNSRP